MPGRSLDYLPERRRKTFVLYTSHTFALPLFAFFIEQENKRRGKPVNVVIASSDERLAEEAEGLQSTLTTGYAIRLGLVRDQHWSSVQPDGVLFALGFSLVRDAKNACKILEALPASVLAISLANGELDELGRIADVWEKAGKDGIVIVRIPLGTTPANIQQSIGRSAVLLSIEEMLRTRLYGKRHLYGSLSAASFAAQRSGFKNTPDYYAHAQLRDPFLPARPDRYFRDEWDECGWDVFLGIGYAPANWYLTYDEARAAARALGANNRRAYEKAVRGQRNRRLHPNPASYYKDKGWVSWFDFLEKEKVGNEFGLILKKYYETYKQASDAAQRLGIRSSPDYLARYTIDPRLPNAPSMVYADDWIDWKDFLGESYKVKSRLESAVSKFYPNITEAQAAAQELGIKSGVEYQKRGAYKKDAKLPSNPGRTYKAHWRGWTDFLGL